MKLRWVILLSIAFISFGLLGEYKISHANKEQKSTECDEYGWFPESFGLKDHSIFVYNGYYYIVSIYRPGEKQFAYARSQDLCNWEDLSPILTDRSGKWDNLAIWAPSVIENNGVYYMYYTGVKGPYPYLTQSIMLATSTDPADPDSWEVEGMVFQPDHLNMDWEDNTWADCRDPMVFKQGSVYYLFYTGRDVDGGIVGMATATSLNGEWRDFGSILKVESGMLESPFIWQSDGVFYLIFNHTGIGALSGEKYHFGPTPGGPWSEELPLSPGWAHEVWSSIDGSTTYVSFLTNYDITIKPLIWDTRYNPAKPFIGEYIFEIFLPNTSR